ncbi:hypothetical protein BKA70DRAFT_1290932 [Coprinopsis sp. MPI-PUGE-AT-0042]|nr:hypothetical protein BKA70DRAFT_1290932 [Coprinopsis sp. MPI-PUGE-AT-0042]
MLPDVTGLMDVGCVFARSRTYAGSTAGSPWAGSLRSLSQRLLFRVFCLSLFFSNDFTIYRLSNLLSCPRLVSYIRDVRLSIVFRSEDRDWLRWVEANSTLLLASFQMLEEISENIQTLSISSGIEVVFSDPTHLEIAKRAAACMEMLAQSPALRSLELSFTAVEILRCCGPSLKHLAVSHEREVEPADVKSLWDTMKRTTPIVLETFDSHYNLGLPPSEMAIHNYLLDSRSLIDLGGLKHVAIRKSSVSLWTEDVQLLKACSESLETLQLGCIHMPVARRYNLHSLKRLRALYFSFARPASEPFDSIQWLAQEFSEPQLQDYPCLQHISISILCTHDPYRISGPHLEAWRALGGRLANPEQFPRLNLCKITIEEEDPWTSSYDWHHGGPSSFKVNLRERREEVTHQIQGAMAALNERALLRVTWA